MIENSGHPYPGRSNMGPDFDVTRRLFVEAFMLGAAGRERKGQSDAERQTTAGRTGLEVSVLGLRIPPRLGETRR